MVHFGLMSEGNHVLILLFKGADIDFKPIFFYLLMNIHSVKDVKEK